MLAGGSNVSLVDSSRRYRPDTNWPGLLDRSSQVGPAVESRSQAGAGRRRGWLPDRAARRHQGRHQRYRVVRSSVSAVPAVARQAGPQQRRPGCGRACRGVRAVGFRATAGAGQPTGLTAGPGGPPRPPTSSTQFSRCSTSSTKSDRSVQRMNGGRKRHQDRPARECSPGRTPQTPTQGRWFPVTHTRSPHTPPLGQCGSNRTGPGR